MKIEQVWLSYTLMRTYLLLANKKDKHTAPYDLAIHQTYYIIIIPYQPINCFIPKSSCSYNLSLHTKLHFREGIHKHRKRKYIHFRCLILNLEHPHDYVFRNNCEMDHAIDTKVYIYFPIRL